MYLFNFICHFFIKSQMRINWKQKTKPPTKKKIIFDFKNVWIRLKSWMHYITNVKYKIEHISKTKNCTKKNLWTIISHFWTIISQKIKIGKLIFHSFFKWKRLFMRGEGVGVCISLTRNNPLASSETCAKKMSSELEQ